MNEILPRRQALKCMASWAGAGIVWTMAGGVPRGVALAEAQTLPADGLRFVQISDTHIGFSKDANPDTVATAAEAIERIRNLKAKPALILHTGDVTHLAKPAEFDRAQQVFEPLKGFETHYVPGEHDVLDETPGALFRERFTPKALGNGWYSFDHRGVHFVALVNVLDLAPGGMGRLGDDQIAWLADDLKPLRDSTPIVVFTHMPMWNVYDPWGWGTTDAAPALALLKRFGSVTVLNGHIHQVLQKVEGNITITTAMSTAYPQPGPGQDATPGPLKVPASELRHYLGVRDVTVLGGSKVARRDQALDA